METNILLFVQENIRTPVLDVLFKSITRLGDSGFIWIAAALVLLMFKRTRKVGLACAAALLLSFLLNNLLLKNLIARARPYEAIAGLKILIEAPHDFSFPSGHAASSFAAATVLFLLLPKKYGIPALILAILISLSRLYIGVHYPTDILGGILSGICIAAFIVWLFKKALSKC